MNVKKYALESPLTVHNTPYPRPLARVLLLAAAVLLPGVGSQTAAAQGAASPKKAEEVFKNIQVLKGVPADDIGVTMRFIQASLGVGCGYCHEGQRDKDTKGQKLLARKMMLMVADLNKNAFGGRTVVTCYTCHRGNPRPVAIPAIGAASTGSELTTPVTEKKADPATLPSVDQVLEKYITALGGTAAVQKISNQVAKGTVTDLEGEKQRVDIYFKVPSKRVWTIQQAKAVNIMYSYDGNSGWVFGDDGPPHALKFVELDAVRLEDPFYFLGRIKQVFSQLRVENIEKIGNSEAYVVSGRTEILPQVKLYFDKESGLLVRTTIQTETAVGRLPVQIDYSDYRVSDGIKIPFKWAVAQSRGRALTTYQLDEVRHPNTNTSEYPGE